MAAFQKQVMDATQETDPNLAKRQQQEYERMASNLNKQFGGRQQAGTPSLGIGTPTGYEAATEQTATDEYARRQKAAGSAFDLGSKVDTRRSQLSDELNAALRKRQLATDKYGTKQSETDRENDLSLAQIGQGAEQKMKELDFTSYKSQTDRNMAMKELYNKGDLNSYLQKAASENALKQQDIDNYYAMLEADLRADFEATIKEKDWDFQQLLVRANRDAANGARIIEALTIAGQSAVTKKTGAA